MKFSYSIIAVFISAFVSSNAVADGELTGDQALACEAILCLSSSTQPSACGPSLSRYFGISFRSWSDTLKGRTNFLNMCPTASSTSSANMPDIVNNLVNGAGQCDAAALNQTNRQIQNISTCPSIDQNRWNEGCTIKQVIVINPTLPANCTAYTNSQFTYQLGVHYIGDPINGGHWVNNAGQ